MTIFSALKPEEVALINDSIRGTQRVQIFNSKVDNSMKKLGSLGVYGPKGVKFNKIIHMVSPETF